MCDNPNVHIHSSWKNEKQIKIGIFVHSVFVVLRMELDDREGKVYVGSD